MSLITLTPTSISLSGIIEVCLLCHVSLGAAAERVLRQVLLKFLKPGLSGSGGAAVCASPGRPRQHDCVGPPLGAVREEGWSEWRVATETPRRFSNSQSRMG